MGCVLLAQSLCFKCFPGSLPSHCCDSALIASQQFSPVINVLSTYLLLTISHCTPQLNRYSLLASSQTAKYLQDGENLQAKIRFCPSLLVTSAPGFSLEKHLYIHTTTHTSQFHLKDTPYPSCQKCKMKD